MGTEYGAYCKDYCFVVALGKDYDEGRLNRLRVIHPEHEVIGYNEHEAAARTFADAELLREDGSFLVRADTTREDFEEQLTHAKYSASPFMLRQRLLERVPLRTCVVCGHEGLSVQRRTYTAPGPGESMYGVEVPACPYHGKTEEERLRICEAVT